MKNDTMKSILVDGVKWRAKQIAECVVLADFDEASENELNELISHLDKSLLGITRLFR